ncbi:MAG TPA: uracil-DNA glycosylase [Candidatus Baltobacteraceae bacterium]|jgi:uracil-DNA glycosylase family 4
MKRDTCDSIDAVSQAVIGCERCPELRAYCAHVAAEKKRAHRDQTYWGKPVPAFGDPRARVMLVGLAPGAHGSNRTGRMFTGDASGDFLYPALYRAGFANRPDAIAPGDGLRLNDCIITAAARCAPPGNKPTPQELRNCFPYLVEEFAALDGVRVAIGLGVVGTNAALKMLAARGFVFEKRAFGHGVEIAARKDGRIVTVIASYHPSRQNTNTGVLTTAMFDAIFTRAREILHA